MKSIYYALVFFIYPLSLQAFDFSSQLELSTNRLRRGVSTTSFSPGVRMNMHLKGPADLITNFGLENTGEKDAMNFSTDLSLAYDWNFLGEWRFLPQVKYYYNPFVPGANTLDVHGELSFLKDHKISVSYNPNYFRLGGTIYTSIESAYSFFDSFKLRAHVGYSVFLKKEKSEQTDYFDLSIGLWHKQQNHSLGIFFSSTTRETIDTVEDIKERADDWALTGVYTLTLG